MFFDKWRGAHAGGLDIPVPDGERQVRPWPNCARQGLPYISVLTNPTMGGVSASLGSLGDINIAEPGALIGFAGPPRH